MSTTASTKPASPRRRRPTKRRWRRCSRGWIGWRRGWPQQRFLVGAQLTEADIRLFTTLVRFDAVYYGHFKCNLRRLVDYPNLWGYARDLYQHPGFGETVNFDQIKRHYYMTHEQINPTRIVPQGASDGLERAAWAGMRHR